MANEKLVANVVITKEDVMDIKAVVDLLNQNKDNLDKMIDLMVNKKREGVDIVSLSFDEAKDIVDALTVYFTLIPGNMLTEMQKATYSKLQIATALPDVESAE